MIVRTKKRRFIMFFLLWVDKILCTVENTQLEYFVEAGAHERQPSFVGALSITTEAVLEEIQLFRV